MTGCEAPNETRSSEILTKENDQIEIAELSVRVIDEDSGDSTPVRVLLTTLDNTVTPLPEAAIGVMWGYMDQATGYTRQPDGAFYVDGSFNVQLKPGIYILTLSKGNEYLSQTHQIELEENQHYQQTYTMERWINMPERGWYSADDHIHLRRSPRENPMILDWIAAEGLHIGVLLQMGDFWTTYFTQYDWGADGIYKENNRFLTSGQEDPRTPELGHTISLGAEDFVRFRDDYYIYDQTFDRVHELGGLTGYAHQGILFHGYRGLTLDVLRNKIDFIEILQYCASEDPLQPQYYYHFLDLGIKLTATAGSDFPWCGTRERPAKIGNARFYTYIDEEFSYDAWRNALRAGHTFVTSGPIVELNVNGAIPGDEINIEKGTSLKISATAYGHYRQLPLESLEIVSHGNVLGVVRPNNQQQSTDQLTIEIEYPAEQGTWIAARVRGKQGQAAHTTPVYVSVNGSGFHNPETASNYLDLSERYLAELEIEIANPNNSVDSHAWRFKEELEQKISEVKGLIEELRNHFAEDVL